MKSASPALIAHLNTANQFMMADLYTFTLRNGVVHRFTTADCRITSDGNVYAPTALITRGGTRCTVGLEVDTLDLTIASGPDLLINGITFTAATVRGDLDGATVRLDRAFMSDWQAAPIGTLMLFEGSVSTSYIDRLDVKLNVKSMLEQFNILMPRRVYQAACGNALFDYSCGLSKSGLAYAGTVLAGTTAIGIITTATALPVAWSNLGTIEFTSGQNAGQKRTVRYNSGGVFVLIEKLPFVPAVGDAFLCYPGCDKSMTACNDKFNNILRFRGHPYIPRPESVL